MSSSQSAKTPFSKSNWMVGSSRNSNNDKNKNKSNNLSSEASISTNASSATRIASNNNNNNYIANTIPRPKSLLYNHNDYMPNTLRTLANDPNNNSNNDTITTTSTTKSQTKKRVLSNTPNSLMAGALPMSLVMESQSQRQQRQQPLFQGSTIHPPRPRRLWEIQDSTIPTWPSYFPPVNPYTSVMIWDGTSPSVLGIRIAECLRKRSIAAEYDEELAMATAMTVDKCHFTIHLWRMTNTNTKEWKNPTNTTRNASCASSIASTDTTTTTNAASMSGAASVVVGGGILVECMRVRGNVHSFHYACRAILQAALGQETGALNDDDDDMMDTYSPVTKRQKKMIHMARTNGLEFGHLLKDTPTTTTDPDDYLSLTKVTTTAEPFHSSSRPYNTTIGNDDNNKENRLTSAHEDWERALELLNKDRLDTQLLGMERLVHLTSPFICGMDVALQVSLQVLNSALLYKYVIAAVPSTTTTTTTTSTNHAHNLTNNKSGSDRVFSLDEGRHESRMRACALRVFCNALSNVSKANVFHKLQSGTITTSNPKKVEHQQPSSLLTDPSLIRSLIADLKGASRPPSVVEMVGVVGGDYSTAAAVSGGIMTSSASSSVHEATLAIRILRLLGLHLPRIYQNLQSEPIFLECLEMIRTCGRSTHLELQKEAEKTYIQLTEDVRSC